MAMEKKITIAILLAVVVIGLDCTKITGAVALSAAQCTLERRLGVNACTPVLYGNPPSPNCCERIRVTHIECVCPVITPQLAALITNVKYAVAIIQSCGRSVPRHFKCGSITTP